MKRHVLGMGEMGYRHGFSGKTGKAKTDWLDLVLGGNIILKIILKKLDM